MEQDDRLLNAMFEMCNHKNPLNDGQREWHIADISGLLREERYDELDERYNQALMESFTSREAEKRYFFAWNQMDNPFYDMDTLVEAGPQGLALIKNWQRARPRSTHAWLAEAQYWNHRAWLYRSYGWARETTRAMWICAAACNERMVIAALNAIDCEPRQWMAAALTSTNSKVFGQPDWLVEFLVGADVAGQPLMEDLAEYHRHSPQEVDALMAHSGLSFADAVCPNLPRPSVLPECNDDAGQKYWLAVCLAIFPTAFYVLDEYIPFRMPRWRGSHEEIREFLESSVCDHLSAAEREHLELLIWWDDHRDLRIKEAWGLFLLNIFEVKDITLAHKHLELVQQEANKGTLHAMVTLSRLHGNKHDRTLFNMKLSARWAHFAFTLYPDNEIVMDCLDHLHFDSFWKRFRFAWYTVRIPNSELPGQVNSMV
ncbi:hypothetical protein CRW80_13635 [Salmonella enterica subsp. enterica serovar Newport]|nr:hypothetical protein [Salmonella enterica subsp. enterica serovar Newport]